MRAIVGLMPHRELMLSQRSTKRSSTPATILAALPEDTEPVALFVTPAVTEVCTTLRTLTRIRAVQWHADDPDPGAETPFRLIAVFRVGAAEDLALATEMLLRWRD